jgi:eukaryotic-like serine/threonine-protein kinase
VTTPSPAPIGMIAHYNLLERLEPSGPGDLFRARDTHRGRTVAIRLLPADSTPGTSDREGLIAQARALIPLSHPNITTLFDAGEHQKRVFVAFEFLRGQSLRAEMAGRPMNPRRALELAVQITDAVSEAHASGFVHGGLSPDSVMVTSKGHAKIPTFHLASQVGFDAARGEQTLHDYDSPEEARGEQADDRSDTYSIGAVLYEMLTTRRPHHRGAAAPSGANARVPPELDAIALKALSPNPASRFQSAVVLAGELRAVAAMLDARDLSDDDALPARRSSKLAPALAAGGLLLAAGVGLLWWLTK